MKVKIRKKDIKLKHNSMNIIAYRATQKIPETWYYIGEDRENNDPLRMKRETGPPKLSYFEHCFWTL
jgi:hypothetical protein